MADFGGFQAGAFQSNFQTSIIVEDIGPSVITFLPISSRNQVSELSDYYLSIAYQDVFGNSIVPASVQWKIWDDTNKQILQPWTQYTPGGAIDTIHIAQAYNAITNTRNLAEVREVTFEITASGGAIRYDTAFYTVLAANDVP